MHLALWIGRYFGYRRLTFDLDNASVRQLYRINSLPLLVVVALAVQLIASYRLESTLGDRTIWDEVFWVADIGIRSGTPLSLAVLFAAGMQKTTRATGSWLLVIGILLVLTGAGFGVASIALITFTGVQEAFNLKAGLWTQWSASLAFLAVGYFFVAYRAGLTRRPRRRFVRRRLAAD